ncbi:diacylglycerol/lipid kinase family protein [Sphingobium sp. HWE2-09]|uniref:diacylglycerol/lipid kinase family protein n=1 Tax=Sphingobium sp. HWE2-09 TaxID=3108390 RepID=UPI002DC99772|nr:diacylglycerol kinase family protein [Sphingobium sp. HWE2-09]
MKALLVHSPNAGTKPEPIRSLMGQLEEAGFAIRYCEHGRDDIRSGMNGMEMAIAAGGDGTVASVATEIPDRSIPIAILPMGGSNNVARALGIRQSIEDVIVSLDDAREKRLTVGSVTGPFGRKGFLEAVGLGALNESIELVDELPDTPEEKRENGRAAFRETLRTAAPIVCGVDIDGRRFDGPWLLVEILNIGAIGPRLPFAPRADTQDRLLDILLVGEADRDAMVGWAEHFSGPPPARLETGCVVTLHASGLCPRIDDRPIDMPDDAWTVEVRLDDEPVTILVPSSMMGHDDAAC